MKRPKLSLQWKFLLIITIIVFPSLSAIFLWEGMAQEKRAVDQILNQAAILSRMVVLVRQWVSDCGGVMVNEKSEGAGAGTCAWFLDDKITTDEGSFRRFTPSMVTKKLSQYSSREDLYSFRLASLNPINPENRPDDFEKEALIRFTEDGLTEAFTFNHREGNQYFQYVVPLYLEKGCLKCHPAGEISKNGIRGGLSVILPVDRVVSSTKIDHLKLAISGMGVISLMILTLFVLLRRLVIRPMRQFEEMAKEIGRGRLDARVDISTGDEFEKLALAFNSMAERISRGRDQLEERINQATKELSEANRELQTLDQLKSDFLANMSHELRSPLTVIRGGIDYLNRTITGEVNRNYLAIIDKNLARLIHLVSDLFDFTRIEGKKADWSFEREDMTGLVQEVMEILSPLAVDKRIAITCECEADIYAEIDLERMEQVLVNLMENAIKFSDEETEIVIDVKEDGDNVVVAVRDQGAGISPENLEIIFEKFHTLPSSGGRGRREGAGLGLAICRGIVEAHGGRIWAESVKGEGSTFFFSIPMQHS
ncbi:MAG: DUF3365 domain-containing protein [Deltaproteobacteria bacterium]|nr:DUF3365 domain-containing protein [Deltaproteobacteria bacterium]MBW2046994.1 DUF3365 domain-containing protein [Deltaproteobacteria bacterium]MBW2111121.1 DUF3365 domain-containing protein [Deltaproteobacteria bacterium]MBW2351696.1 DUF3365 domain-containing protein [Deltaproteobacteria bacterium]HDZ90587.1 DUF3365 domain-containing protein [Deltaproteobacteria bacterium]